ncbi:MAG: hypothetical protein RDV41_09700, partial [Planctomycetota bacterium]|nr:hypothetical protein [Planctomycetota bacterium]
VNMPARSVIFDSVSKFDGVRRSFLKTREYQQMAGRAGRRGMDEHGFVYANVDWPFNGYDDVARIMTGEVEPINSQFNLSYATLLSLYSRLGEETLRACEESFANFEAERARGGRRSGPHEPYGRMVDQVRRRIGLLKRLGHIDRAGAVTEKGEFARKINGYELQAAESMFSGLLGALDSDLLAVHAAAIVFEARRGEWYSKLDRRFLRRVKNSTNSIVERIRDLERKSGIAMLSKEADFRLSSVVLAWKHGAALDELEKHTSSAQGDIIRGLRLTLQLLRQIETAMPAERGDDRLRANLIEAMMNIKRDEVDAERQLRA